MEDSEKETLATLIELKMDVKYLKASQEEMKASLNSQSQKYCLKEDFDSFVQEHNNNGKEKLRNALTVIGIIASIVLGALALILK